MSNCLTRQSRISTVPRAPPPASIIRFSCHAFREPHLPLPHPLPHTATLVRIRLPGKSPSAARSPSGDPGIRARKAGRHAAKLLPINIVCLHLYMNIPPSLRPRASQNTCYPRLEALNKVRVSAENDKMTETFYASKRTFMCTIQVQEN